MENNQQPAQPAPQNQSGQVQVKVTDEVLKGIYANMVQVGHSSEEFILDFMNIFPPAGQLNARIIISPSHAKRVANALVENIKKYEEQYGTISLAVVPDQKIGFKTE